MSITAQREGKKKHVTFRLPDSMRTRLKVVAARCDRSLQDVVVAALDAYLPSLERAVSSERPAHKKT